MNNNWSFNNFKGETDNEELKKVIKEENIEVNQLIENEPMIENLKYKNSFTNLDDKKKLALIKLLIGLAFFVGIIIFLNFSDKTSTESSKLTSITTTMTPQNSVVDKTLLNKINKNIYTFNYILTYNVNKKDITVNYKGLVKGSETIILKTINSLKNKYYINSDKFYLIDNDNNYEINKMETFENFDSKYFDINNIYSYLDKGSLEWKTTYKDKTSIENYNIYLKDIILTSDMESYISITTNNKEANKLKIKIDYSKLFNNIYENVFNVKLDMVYELVTEENIKNVEKEFS